MQKKKAWNDEKNESGEYLRAICFADHKHKWTTTAFIEYTCACKHCDSSNGDGITISQEKGSIYWEILF